MNPTVSSDQRARLVLLGLWAGLLLGLLPETVWAAGSGMPWEAPLQGVLDSVSGPVANAFGIIAITVFGLVLAFGGAGGGLRMAVGVLFGISVAFAAVSFFPAFFGFTGGMVVP